MRTIMRKGDGALRLMLLAAFALYFWSCGSTKYSGSILNQRRPVQRPPAADSIAVLYHFAGGAAPKPGRLAISWRADTLGTFRVTKKQLEAMIYPAKYSGQDHLTINYERRYESQLIVHWYSGGEVADSSDTIAIPIARLERMDCEAMRRYDPSNSKWPAVAFEKSWNVLKGNATLAFDTKTKTVSLSLSKEPILTPYPCKGIICLPMDPDTSVY